MKKKKINSKKLKLNKKMVSNLDANELTGGTIVYTLHCSVACPSRFCQSQIICPSQLICPTSLAGGCPTTTYNPTDDLTTINQTTINQTF